MRKLICVLICLGMLTGSACAAGEFEGVVVGGGIASIFAPYGGVVGQTALREGALLHVGDEIARMNTTRVLAAEDGTVRGIFANEGDSAEGTVLYVAPVSKFTISCSIDQAHNSVETKYVTIGEKVYIKCAPDGSHRALGIITAVNGSDYTVQTTAGELYMEETVYLYRMEDCRSESRIGSGKVSRTEAIAVKGSGSVLKMHVEDGDTVERGQVLFETVEGELDAFAASDEVIRSTLDGVVAEMKVAAGQKVTKGDVLLTVYQAGDYQVQFAIPEDSLSDVHIGGSAELYFNWNEDKSEPFTGTVTEVSYVSDSSEGEVTYSGYIRFTADESVRLGMNVSVVLEGY